MRGERLRSRRDCSTPRSAGTRSSPRSAASLPPCTSKVTTVPPPLICARASATLRMIGARRVPDPRHRRPARRGNRRSRRRRGSPPRRAAASVSSPFSSTQALNGDSAGPVLRMNGCSVSLIHLRDPSTAPPSTRPWPSICLVQEYTTTSAPSCSGCCSSGVANTLSTTTIAPAACASSATARRSTMSSIGLDGVSSSTSWVGCASASRHWPRSPPSTNSADDAVARQQGGNDPVAGAEQRARRRPRGRPPSGAPAARRAPPPCRWRWRGRPRRPRSAPDAPPAS